MVNSPQHGNHAKLLSRRFKIVVSIACATAFVAGAVVWKSLSRDPEPRYAAFPEDRQVVSVVASLNQSPGLIPAAVSPFRVPAEFVPKLLAMFRPAQIADYPALWDQDTLGKLAIETTSGKTHVITFCFAGKNALCFTFDGVRCVRGGKRGPLQIDPEGYEHWAAEGPGVSSIIRELNKSPLDHEKIDALFDDMERSTGLRPPKRRSRFARAD